MSTQRPPVAPRPEFGEPLPPAAWDHISDLEQRIAELKAALRNEMRLRQGYPLDEGEVRKATYAALASKTTTAPNSPD